MGGGAECCNAALAKVHMKGIVEHGGGGITDDGGEEDEGYDRVAEVVVCFQLTGLRQYTLLKRTIDLVDLRRESRPVLIVS